LRSALSTLREQYSDLEDAHSTLSRASSKSLATQKSQITTLTHQVSVLSQELQECKRISEERQQAIHGVQEKLDALELKESTDAVQTANGDMAIIREELHRQIGYLRSLESANARLDAELRVLRGRHESVEVLREEKRWLELRVHNYEEMRERVVSLEAELEAARKERQNW
jgi:mitotic spindle assembly checkpoint protein MAD1